MVEEEEEEQLVVVEASFEVTEGTSPLPPPLATKSHQQIASASKLFIGIYKKKLLGTMIKYGENRVAASQLNNLNRVHSKKEAV